MPKALALSEPATTLKHGEDDRAGTVIERGDSWGSPWPRYSPKNVSYTHRVM